MDSRKSRYIFLFFILMSLLLWIKRKDIFLHFFIGSKPEPQALDFNQKNSAVLNPVFISPDEEINIKVFKKVKPAVVNITATTLALNFWLEIVPSRGQGSGIIIDHNGYILTNSHVVAKAQKIIVTLSNGTKVAATLIGRDIESDIAVIKIPAEYVEAVATLGESNNLRCGQKVIAIGNPFGLSHTLTTGVISALNRDILTENGIRLEGLIQTDAAINPGNSGGPLLNSMGEVIGINTAIYTTSGGYQGIGFAIPINRAKQIATQLITKGRVVRPWLGISGVTVTSRLAKFLGLGIEKGILIIRVVKDGPADQAGIKGGNKEVIFDGMRLVAGGDVIAAINGREINGVKQLREIIMDMKVGQRITVRIYREGMPMDVDVVLSERP